MADPALDGPARGDKGLAQHLAAEDALHAVFRALAAENVLFNLLEIQEVEDFFDRGAAFLAHSGCLSGLFRRCKMVRAQGGPAPRGTGKFLCAASVNPS